MTERENKGAWWLPDDPTNRVAGTLVMTEGEFPTLELIGAFREQPSATTLCVPEIILGLAGKQPVTLYRCARTGVKHQYTSMTHPSSGSRTEQYIAEVVLRGAHFSIGRSIVFAKMALELDALFEWAGISGFSIERGNDEHDRAEFT